MATIPETYFSLRPGVSGISIRPRIMDAPVQEILVCGALGWPRETRRNTRNARYAFASCLCTSPEAKPYASYPTGQFQATDISQVGGPVRVFFAAL
ncbi:hypothetical protein STEG23_022797 [Scotinomys teguina]